jgi:hypothetical protein
MIPPRPRSLACIDSACRNLLIQRVEDIGSQDGSLAEASTHGDGAVPRIHAANDLIGSF